MVPSKLVDQAFETVCENIIDKYDEDLVKTVSGLFRHKMIDKIFQWAENHRSFCDGQEHHIDYFWAILPSLIKSKSFIKLDIRRDLPFMYCNSSAKLSNSRFQEFIRSLGSNTPNLKELKIDLQRWTLGCVNSLGKRELASIVQLKDLAILEIHNVYVPMSGVFDISRQCEKLKSISTSHIIVDEYPPSFTFRNDLEHVCICTDDSSPAGWLLVGDEKDHTELYNVIIQPRSSVAFLKVAQPFAGEITRIDFNFGFLEDDTEEMVEFPHFPQIKYATINCFEKSVHAFIRCFLKSHGERLQELRLCGVDIKDNISFSEIFSFCPNLESLELYRCGISGNDAPVDAMQQLKRFQWDWICRDSDDEVAFSSIWSAPLLEDVYIELPETDFSDNATIIARIQRREILRNLKKFHMEIYSDELENYKELNDAIVSVVSANC